MHAEIDKTQSIGGGVQEDVIPMTKSSGSSLPPNLSPMRNTVRPFIFIKRRQTQHEDTYNYSTINRVWRQSGEELALMPSPKIYLMVSLIFRWTQFDREMFDRILFSDGPLNPGPRI